MKTLGKSLIIVAGLAIFSTSCQKDKEQDNAVVNNQVSSTREMKVPQNFNYETDKEVNFSFNLEQPPMQGKYLVEIYDFVPTAGRGVVKSSFVSSGESFTGSVALASFVEQLYVVTYAPDGSSFLTVLPLSGNSVSHTFYRAKRNMKTGISSPDCISGCDQTVNNSNSWWTANDKDDVYCVTGTYNGGGITIQKGAVVRLCGSGNFNTISVNKGKLVITDGADVTIANLNLNSGGDNELIVHANASLTLTNWFSPNSEIYNAGTMDVAALNLNANADLENVGTFTVTGNDWTSLNGDIENDGAMTFNHHVNLNANCDLENQCSLTFEKQLILNGSIENYAFVEVKELARINGSGRIFPNDGSMTLLEDLWLDGKIDGSGTTSLVKVKDRSDANSSGDIKGNVEFCDANGIENFPANTIRQGAVESCNLYIPTSTCNAVGNGTPAIADADGDGVSDAIDIYPNDASRAANSFYPSQNGFASLGFEDLWPAYGDYDFNDLVVDYRHQYVLNASNDVVDMNSTIVTRALGGSFENGFGFQLDVNSAAVSSVNGTEYFNGIVSTGSNGTEVGQSKATIVVYDDATKILENQGGSFVNTVEGNPYVQPDTMQVSVSFSSPVTQSALGSAPHNPFIFVDGNRGREVHLAGNQPTDLADASFFGTGNDNTTAGTNNTYKSPTNLPWAINVTDGFDYPEEKEDIVQVYSLFSTWAQSGGLSATDWYQDNPGYINAGKLYQ